MDKFWRGFNLAIGQNAIFGEDLIWRMMNFVKFGGDLIWRMRDFDKFGEDLIWRKAQKHRTSPSKEKTKEQKSCLITPTGYKNFFW